MKSRQKTCKILYTTMLGYCCICYYHDKSVLSASEITHHWLAESHSANTYTTETSLALLIPPTGDYGVPHITTHAPIHLLHVCIIIICTCTLHAVVS